MKRFSLCCLLIFLVPLLISGCTTNAVNVGNVGASKDNGEGEENWFPFEQQLTGTLNAAPNQTFVGDVIKVSAKDLKTNAPFQLIWITVNGEYALEGIYRFIGTRYHPTYLTLFEGKSNPDGTWEGEVTVPEDFGGHHTLAIVQNEKITAQANVFVAPKFSISPESGPIGTEITVMAKGIGFNQMESNWQLTWDNKLTGMISAVSTKGTAVAKIRAAGGIGKHSITIWHGLLGLPYINHQDAPTKYLPVPSFTFEVTDEPPIMQNIVEPIPQAAGGGVSMPKLVNEPGVQVTLNKQQGTVGEMVKLEASGLPKKENVQLIWNTMKGNRVTAAGFAEYSTNLASLQTDDAGKLSYEFAIPADLGGVPHRIDIKSGEKILGQAYLSILPSIVSITPTSGPVGTPIRITINGVGWTEYDNAYQLTYDNAYVGYMCGFNTQGTVTFEVIATGEPGYHIIDLYPGIYKGEQKTPDIYNLPQLTYLHDHPGSGIPAIRLGFEVTGQ